jgi:hypothetical protein
MGASLWVGLLMVILLTAQHLGYRRLVGEKDRRIRELEHLVAEYREGHGVAIDVDDVNLLLAGKPEDKVDEPVEGLDLAP